MLTLESFFESIQLPSIPDVAHELIQTLNNDDTTLEEVAALLSKDPALTAKVLRLANSAQFGLPKKVGSLHDAMHMVGFTKIRTLALGSCLNNVFPEVPGLDAKQFWKTSMACAGYAEWLARETCANPQQAWLTGMMLRLGEILLAQKHLDLLKAIELAPLQPGERWSREKTLLGFTEGDITAELARRWNFPQAMVDALIQCSDPQPCENFSQLGAVVHLAGILADIPNAMPRHVNNLPTAVLKMLALKLDRLHEKFPKNIDSVTV